MLDNLVWNTETILVLGIVTFVAFALLILVIWNNKTNKQVKTLISIDDSLKHLEVIEPTNALGDPNPIIEAFEPQPVQEEEPVEIAEKTIEPESGAIVGKSGRVYTKEELEAQIR